MTNKKQEIKELSLFTGIGGGIYGSIILGWKTIAYVEKDKYCQKVIAQRIKDNWFNDGEIYGDIKEFNREHAHKYKGKIDIITGGFPCQPHSVAGKRKGRNDERYLFDEILKTIEIIQPARLFFENVPGILRDPAIIDIYQSLKRLDYDVKPALVLGSDDCHNIHRRKRVWIFANRCSELSPYKASSRQPATVAQCAVRLQAKWGAVYDTNTTEFISNGTKSKSGFSHKSQACKSRDEICRDYIRFDRRKIRNIKELFARPNIPNPLVCGVDDATSYRRKRLRAIGNAQDPIVMATAYQLLEDL